MMVTCLCSRDHIATRTKMTQITTVAQTNRFAVSVFAGLQALDVATTLVGFHFGAAEQNGVLKLFCGLLGPVAGLLLGKFLTASLVLGFALTRRNPAKLLKVANVFFTALVIWNVVIIGLQAGLAR